MQGRVDGKMSKKMDKWIDGWWMIYDGGWILDGTIAVNG